ncbi:MAG: putative primase, partial [Bacteroidetes bacterium]|nr:putative primase [Bacteroidota bacterium]
IIQKLGVKEVIFIFDSDYNELSNHIKINDSVDKRPRNFYYAAKSFKEYMYTLKIRDIYVEIYIGHVKPNSKSDKGIDDLLSNTLKDDPDLLKIDLDTLINKKDLTGEYIRLFKVTTWTDSKLEEIWHLNNPTAFANAHKSVLKNYPEFRIGRHIWRFNSAGEIESAQPLEAEEKYWDEIKENDRNGDPKPIRYEFKYGRCFTFLQNRGFFRHRELDGKTFVFVKVEHPVVRPVEYWEIQDYIIEFTKVSANEGVLEMLYRGGEQYLGPNKLKNLIFFNPNFEQPARDRQRLYFKENCFDITAAGIKESNYSSVNYNIWADQKRDFSAQLVPEKLIDVQLNDENEFSYTITKAGQRCQFLQFLVNSSNYTWRKEKQIRDGDTTITIEPNELYENTLHLLSKLAAFGYLVLSAKDRSISRAVVAMDGKQSEVGQSNGRSGKSILGEALKQIQKTLYIDGKKKEIESDPFIWDGLDEKYYSVFLDDVRTNFSIEFLFANITGDWNANWKGGRRFTIPFAQSPKIYITTNHALNGSGSSFMDRQYLIAFSDFYSDEHKPIDDFGGLFFDDWDWDQWNLFWNLVANCLHIYIKYGAIQAPSERIETRQLRQTMGEMFLSWADEYFSDDSKLNTQLNKKMLYDEYLKYSNLPPKMITPTRFKNNLKTFCKWKGYKFNAHMYDPLSGKALNFDRDGRPVEDDKSGGIEYVSLYDRPVNGTDISTPVVKPINQDGVLIPPTTDKPF